jgi:hypothetical protein
MPRPVFLDTVAPQAPNLTQASQSAKADFVWSLQRIHSPVQGRARAELIDTGP